MKRLALVALLMPSLASPALAAPAEPAPFEILRPTDKTLSCEQLASEFNQLNAEAEKAKAAELAKAKRSQTAGMVLGLASGLTGGLLGGRGGGYGVYGASALSQAASAAAITGADQSRTAMMGGMMAGVLGPQAAATPQQQRSEHLMDLYRSKSC